MPSNGTTQLLKMSRSSFPCDVRTKAINSRDLQVGELTEALDAIKWGIDYLLQCHVEPMKFIAMYGASEVWV